MKNREFLKTKRIMNKESQSSQNNNKQSNIHVVRVPKRKGWQGKGR